MRRKIFITLCSVLSAVFLTSYLFIFFLFRSVLFQEIRQQQINLQKYNETIFTSYIDSFSMVPFQLVNDEEIGELANTNNSSPIWICSVPGNFCAKNSITISISSFLPPISTAVFCFT